MSKVVEQQRQTDQTQAERPDPERYVYCAACSNVIAHQNDRTEINGAFNHICTNPYGLTFDIGCFAQALGCSIAGGRNAADTWFSGFEWRLALCDECQTHLGWYFDREDAFFYGLILDKLQTDKS